MHRALAIAVLMLTANAAWASVPQSELGNANCGENGKIKCDNPQAKTISCSDDRDCVLPPDAPKGGLPYACLVDVKLCGWKGEPRPKKIEEHHD